MPYIRYEDDENWVLWVCPDPECDEIIHDPGAAGPIVCTNYDVHTLGEYPNLVRTPVVPVDADIEALRLNLRLMSEREQGDPDGYLRARGVLRDVRRSWDPEAAGRRAVEKHGDALKALADDPCTCETDERYHGRDGWLHCSLCDRRVYQRAPGSKD